MAQERGPIEIEEAVFEDLNGQELLRRIRNDDLDGTEVQLQEVLKCILEKYGQGKNKQNRQVRRQKRIEVYNGLLPIALGAEGGDWNTWCYGESAAKFWDDESVSKLVPGSIYTYLLDHIFEDEEIMFKFYHSRKLLRKHAFWLVESMESYRMYLVNPIITILMKWEEEKKDFCQQLLAEAKNAFKAKLLSCQRSWRSRARMYWLLARAAHAPISNGQVWNFKSFSYTGPVGTLVEEMIKEDKDMLLDRDRDLLIFDNTRVKYDKKDKSLQLGTLRICSLLAWASAAKFHDLVKCILQHKDDYRKRDECDAKWEKDWAESWAHALWNAAFMGHDQIVKELLNCDELDSKHFLDEETQPPLHVAVRKGHISVVKVFCCESKDFNCHEEDHILHQTPLEVTTKHTDASIKRKIQNILLQRPEVKEAVADSYRQRELTVGSANAIIVGAALIAGVTFGGWLQPPLGFNSYYQFPEPLPAPPDSYESYLSVQSHTSIRVFAIFNSLSFFCAIAAIVAGMETTCFIEDLEETYIEKTVKNLQSKLKRTTTLFIVSVIFVLVAFASAAIAILPPINRYQWDMYITIFLGGLICLLFIGRMLLLCVSKRLYKETTSWFERMSDRMVRVLYTLFNWRCELTFLKGKRKAMEAPCNNRQRF